MKTNKILCLMLTLIFALSLMMPVMAFAKGENDFGTSLSVSDNSVKAGTTVTCTISVTNTDPTYYAEVVVQTSSGSPVGTLIVMSNETKSIKHNVVINETTDIYYKIIASHGPDISKTKNTNTQRVVVETEPTPTPTPTPTPEPEPEPEPEPDPIEAPEALPATTEVPQPPQPIHGVPCSGSIYSVEFVDVTLNGEDTNRLIAQTGDDISIHCSIRYNIPDGVMDTYHERSEGAYAYVWFLISSPSLPEPIRQEIRVDTDSGVLDFDAALVMPDDSTNCELYATLIDPVTDSGDSDWQMKELINGPDESEYDLWMGVFNVNGTIVMPGGTIDVAEGEDIHISQAVYYNVPEAEFELSESYRVIMEPNVRIDGVDLEGWPQRAMVNPETTEGRFILDIDIESVQIVSENIEISTRVEQQRRSGVRPIVNNECRAGININIIDPSGWGAPVPDDELTVLEAIFDGLFRMDISEWLGLHALRPTIDLVPFVSDVTLIGDHNLDLRGRIEYRGPENTTVRLSGGEGFGEPMEIATSGDAWGTARYEGINAYVEDTARFELTAELINEEGEVIATDTEIIRAIYQDKFDDINYAQEFTLFTISPVVTQGQPAIINFGLENNRSGQQVHVRVIDERDDSVVLNDETLRRFGSAAGVVTVAPEESTSYYFTAQVLTEDESVLWEQTKRVTIGVVPNRAEPFEGSDEFNLNIGASDTVIAPGETVTILGNVHYGTIGGAGPYENLVLRVDDQDANSLHRDVHFVPNEISEFSRDYELEATTTFIITAIGYSSDGTIAYEDTDRITIEVDEAEAPEPPSDEESSFMLDLTLVAPETVVAPGEMVGIISVVDNVSLSDEEIYVEVIDNNDGRIINRGFSARGGRMTSPDIYSLDTTTTFSHTANGYLLDGTLVASETREVTIVVDDSLLDPPGADGEHRVHLFADAIANPIEVGQDTGIIYNATNTGREPIDIHILDSEDNVLYSEAGVAPGENITGELFRGWSPEETSTVVLKAVGYVADTVVCRDAQAVTVNVIDPHEGMYDNDLIMTETEYHAEAGETIDIPFEVWNMGTESYDIEISEDATGWNETVNDFEPATWHEGMITFLAEESATLTFRASSKVGDEVMYTDVETVEVIVADAGVGDAADDEAGEYDEEASGADDIDEAGGSDGAEDGEGVVEPITIETSDGVSASVIPLDVDSSDGGSIVLVSDTEEQEEQERKLYTARRWIAVCFILLVVLMILLIIYLVSRLRKKGMVIQ